MLGKSRMIAVVTMGSYDSSSGILILDQKTLISYEFQDPIFSKTCPARQAGLPSTAPNRYLLLLLTMTLMKASDRNVSKPTGSCAVNSSAPRAFFKCNFLALLTERLGWLALLNLGRLVMPSGCFALCFTEPV